MKTPTLKDDDGQPTRAGDTVRFSYGIPPCVVRGPVVQRGQSLFVLTPGHTPPETNLRTLRRYVGTWYRENTEATGAQRPV